MKLLREIKRRTLFYLHLFILQTFSFYSFSQAQHVKFEHLGTDQGLSQSNVTCIIQDSRGFMWFGTRDGLNKYDGYKFTVYKNDVKNKNSLSNDHICDIFESPEGNIWIATRGGGLNNYNREKDQFTSYKHDAQNKNSLSSNLVNSVLEDSRGIVWIGTEDGGLNMFDSKKNKFVHFTYERNNDKSLGDIFVRHIFEDSRHNLWIGTAHGGLNLFDRQSQTFKRFQYNEKDSLSISSNNVSKIFEDSEHRLWIGTEGGGLNLFIPETGRFRHFKHDQLNKNSLSSDAIYSINEVNEGNLWIGTENGGLNIYNSKSGLFEIYDTDEFDNTSLSNNSVWSICKDTKGNIWLGTFNGGINIVNRDASKFIHYKHNPSRNSLSHNKVLCIYEDTKANIWIGTDGGGLNLFDPRKETFTYYRHQPGNKNSICGNYVLSVFEDDKENLWVGTWGDGITVFNKAKNTFKHFKNNPANGASLSSNNAWVIFQDHDKNIWVGTYGGGLNLYNPDNDSFSRYQYDENDPSGINNNKIHSMFEDKEGNLLVSTDGGGINLFDKRKKTFTHLIHDDKKNSISNNSVGGIYEDRNGVLWISTMVGLNSLDRRTNTFTAYTTKDGLPNNTILGILGDGKGNLWISTNKGISRFTPVAKTFRNFGVADGLQSSEFKEMAYCKSRSGAMYFGGNNGFNSFFPDSIKDNPFEPPLVITGFQIFNKEVPIADDHAVESPLKKSISETTEITVSYKSSVISFEFASLNYTSAEKKQYSYMLEGFDKTWNEVGSKRTATYTNLDPGKYIFKVRGSDNEGKWSSREISVQLTITPPFWLTWWFKALVFITIVGGAIGFFRIRISAINAQKIKLQELVKEQTHQLIESTEMEQMARREADKARLETGHANTALEKKNKELEQFAYIASHDLQEPLRTTSSFVKLLQKHFQSQADEKTEKYFTFILDASDRMKLLIKNLLDLSRIGNKKEPEKVDCNEMLHNVIADLGVAICEAKADITYTSLPVVTGYSTEIKQLFQNLITNAIKFRREGIVPQINISVKENPGYWEFLVKDNGIGIEEKHSEKIFVIFQRLHTRDEYEGTGIGLSHCKKIVELHKGEIWVESTVGQGSTFHFTILQISIPQNNMSHAKLTSLLN